MFNVTIVWIPRVAARHWKNEVMKRGWRIVDWWEEPLGDGDMVQQQNQKGYMQMQMQHTEGERCSGNRLQR